MNKYGTIEKKANKSKLLRQLVASGVNPKEAISVVSALPRKNVRSQRPPIEALEGSYNVRIRAERKRNPSLASSREDRKIFAQEEGNARAFFAQSPSTRTEDSARRAGTTSDARTKKPKISGTRHRRIKPYIPPQPERIFVASPPSEPQIQTRTRIVRPSAQKEFARGFATGLPYAMLIAEMMRRQRP